MVCVPGSEEEPAVGEGRGGFVWLEGVGGESGGLERKNRHSAATVAPKLPGPPCGFLSKVWKVPEPLGYRIAPR